MNKLLTSSILFAAISQIAMAADPVAPVLPEPPMANLPAPFSTKSRFSASARIELYGPAITALGDNRPNLSTGVGNDPKQEVFTKNKINLAYKISGDQSIGLGLQAYTLAKSGTSMRDPFVFFRDSHAIQSGRYNMDAAIRFYAGVSEISRKKYHTPVGFRFVQDSTYKLTDGQTVLSLYAEIHWYVHNPRAINDRELEFFLVPNVDYRINSKFSFNFAVKIWAYHNVGRVLNDLAYDPVLLSPGIVWEPIKNVHLNPYLDFAAQNLSLAMTTLGFNVNWKFL